MRIIYFDYLKLFASFLIVCYHIQSFPLHEIAYSGLFIFLIVGVFLQATSLTTNHAANFLLEKRILIPWLLWSLFYLLLNVICKNCYFTDYSYNRILVGGNIHLWYLPFIYLVYQLIKRFDVTNKRLIGFYLILFFILQFSATAWRPFSLDLIEPFPQYLHALSGVVIGLIYATLEGYDTKNKSLFFALVTTAVLVTSLLSINLPGMGKPLIIATMTFAAFKLAFFKRMSNSFVINKYSYGIYLIHPFIVSIVMKLSKLLKLDIPLAFYPVVVFILSIVTLIVLSLVLKDKTKYLY